MAALGHEQRGAARQALPDPGRRGLTGALLGWYADHGRELPWRRTGDPYAILVSEVMLQQTQVARVIPRWEAWLGRWPDAASLAAASPADVLREWVGLGYNRRALRLRDAAAVVARDGWPDDLTALPGVGPYTAAAVGAFAFGRQVVAVDTNVARVMARAGAMAPPPGLAGAFNHALMDLGATLCTARRPRCEACPLTGCASRGAVVTPARGAPGARPRVRFEDTDRYARGRVVAALAGDQALPTHLGEERLERALCALERDGMLVRGADGAPRLPG